MSEQAEKPVILVVDDSKVIRRAASKMLGDEYEVLEALHGADAWEQLQQNSAISVVFTDMQMPEMNGVQLLEHIRAAEDEHINAIPVIMITGHDDTEAAKKEVYDRGATDFISKPFESIDLLTRAKSYARLTRRVADLEKQTGTDKLTGLFNTAHFQEQGEKTLSFAQRHRLGISVVYLEIAAFEDLFLAQGKSVAQQILKAVARRMGETLRAEDVAARIAVARFALLLPSTNQSMARAAVIRIRESVNKLVFDTGSEKLRINMKAGIAAHDTSGDFTFAELMSQAEQALDAANAASDEDIASYSEPVSAQPAAELGDEDIAAALQMIVQGEHFQIPENHLVPLLDRLQAFIEYAESHRAAQLTASGESI